MSYSVSITHTCAICHRAATHEVFNHRNATMGYFCLGHSNAKMLKLDVAEAKSGKLK